jgi:hypothetical protein
MPPKFREERPRMRRERRDAKKPSPRRRLQEFCCAAPIASGLVENALGSAQPISTKPLSLALHAGPRRSVMQMQMPEPIMPPPPPMPGEPLPGDDLPPLPVSEPPSDLPAEPAPMEM